MICVGSEPSPGASTSPPRDNRTGQDVTSEHHVAKYLAEIPRIWSDDHNATVTLWKAVCCGHYNAAPQPPDEHSRTIEQARTKFPGEEEGFDLDVLPTVEKS